MLRHTLRGNYAAPIANPQSILDVGSGAGRWAMKMAGMTNVVSRAITLPVGAYGGRVGRLAETDVFGVVGGKGLVTSMGATSPEAYDNAMRKARADRAS